MDDDVQLNFALPASAGGSQPPPAKRRKLESSGPWREKVKRQHIADSRASKKSKAVEAEPQREPLTPAEPVNDITAPPAQVSPRKPTAARKAIISSLFSSRPNVPAVKEEERPVEPAKPSNAPSDGSFQSTGLRQELVDVVTGAKMGLERPTPIQLSALPLLLTPKQDHDVILQAQTGSGKTLAYLLPIIQDLLALAQRSAKLGQPLERSVGTLAIILVPTRELANQIYETAQSLLSFRGDGSASPRWLTPGLLSGGMHRQHEKARLRKGLPLLIATPGRLIDHLTSTSSFRLAGEPVKKKRKQADAADDFDVEDNPAAARATDDSDSDDFTKPTSRSYKPRFADKPDPALTLRWLVLDEADRLMDMGFEPQIKEILTNLEKRARPQQAARRTVLCSATMQESVEKLAGMALRKPQTLTAAPPKSEPSTTSERPAPPAQLLQSYVVVPPKLRFVALVSLLRRLFAQPKAGKGKADAENKALVFVSCTAAADLLWSALGGLQLGFQGEESDEEDEEQVGLVQQSMVLPRTGIFRLHGNLDLQSRLASLKGFASAPGSSVLICTSVAARGLDVPFVRSVVQYDLPTEGGVNEYIHRVGRTARAGRAGESWAFLLPSESGWVSWAEERMNEASSKAISLRNVSVDALLQEGFGGDDFETRATDVQMAFERWVEKSDEHAKLGRNAFTSHVRAYATHPSDEKHLFHVKNLHLGHLAKSFGLREAPNDIKLGANQSNNKKRTQQAAADSENEGRVKQPRTGRATEGRGLPPARADASEFAITGADEIEKMLSKGKRRR